MKRQLILSVNAPKELSDRQVARLVKMLLDNGQEFCDDIIENEPDHTAYRQAGQAVSLTMKSVKTLPKTPAKRSVKKHPVVAEMLLEHALEVCKTLDLGYMSAAGDFLPGSDEPFSEDVQRFMVFETTDGDDDGWVHFFDTTEEVEAHVANLVGDEWGVSKIFDLAADDYYQPLNFNIKATLSW